MAFLPTGLLTQRISERRAVAADAICRTATGRTFSVRLSDISEEGCRISFKRNYLSVNDCLSIKTGGLEGLAARVCWSCGFVAGVKFDRPLYGPVFEHLARLNAKEA